MDGRTEEKGRRTEERRRKEEKPFGATFEGGKGRRYEIEKYPLCLKKVSTLCATNFVFFFLFACFKLFFSLEANKPFSLFPSFSFPNPPPPPPLHIMFLPSSSSFVSFSKAFLGLIAASGARLSLPLSSAHKRKNIPPRQKVFWTPLPLSCES